MKPCPVSFILLYDTRIEMVDIIFSEIGHVEKDKIFPCAESVQVDCVNDDHQSTRKMTDGLSFIWRY